MSISYPNAAPSPLIIPARWIRALAALSCKKVDRDFLHTEWLMGVSIDEGVLFATDGVCLGAILDARFVGVPALTIPKEILSELLLLLRLRTVVHQNVHLQRWMDDDGVPNALLTFDSFKRHFYPLCPGEGNVTAKLCTHTVPAGHPQINWDLLRKFSDAAQILGAGKKNPYKLHLVPNGSDKAVRFKMPHFPAFEGTVMPLRSESLKEYNAAPAVSE